MAELARLIRVFDEWRPVFKIIDRVADFEKRPPLNYYFPVVQWQALADYCQLSEGNVVGSWQERVANLRNPKVLKSKETRELEIDWVTSYDIRAARNGSFKSDAFFQLAAIGVVITRDNQILLGLRGGEPTPERKEKIGAGLLGALPGGSVTFKPEYKHDPIIDTVLEEFTDEIGDFKIVSKSEEIIGVFEAFRPGPTGIKFVTCLTTDARLVQIQKINRRANHDYWRRINQGASHQDAARELKEAGLPPDAWEHFPIIGFPNDHDAVKRWLEIMPQSLTGIGAGALMTYDVFMRLQA